MIQNLTPLTEPFTIENFNEDEWQKITDEIEKLTASDEGEEQAIPFIKDFRRFIIQLNTCSDYTKCFTNESSKDYFLRNFLPKNTTHLIHKKTFGQSEAFLELWNSCLEQIVLFWIKTIPGDYVELTEVVKNLLDPNTICHKITNQESFVEEIIPSFNREQSQEHLDWINTLKKDDIIDCVKIDHAFKLMCWSHAKVIKVFEKKVKILYLGEEGYKKELNKVLNANEIAPYKTKCKDFDWRLNLKEGDIIDVCDTTFIWYNSTVLKIRETNKEQDKVVKEVLIGYRVYDETGNRREIEGKPYIGWSSTYDEWINVTNPRISEYKNDLRPHITDYLIERIA